MTLAQRYELRVKFNTKIINNSDLRLTRITLVINNGLETMKTKDPESWSHLKSQSTVFQDLLDLGFRVFSPQTDEGVDFRLHSWIRTAVATHVTLPLEKTREQIIL